MRSKKIKEIIASVMVALWLPLLLIGGSMCAEFWETLSLTQLIVGISLLTIDFVDFGVYFMLDRKNVI